MTEEEQTKEFLKNKGCPEHIWKHGSQGLIRHWDEFVTQVEEGYCPDCLIDEYWNDLDVRELIHEIGQDSAVADADARLRAVLTATNIKHRYKDRNTDYDFWNYGYPKNASGFFYQEIKRHILKEA
jgi:hypothetical protein